MKGTGRVWVAEATGGVTTLDSPAPDPYWDAYARAVREGWR